jgi:DNA-binding MarR family transcriptional regulator
LLAFGLALVDQEPAHGSELPTRAPRDTIHHARAKVHAEIARRGSASPKEIKVATGLTNHLVKAALAALVEDHLAVKSGATRAVRYRLEASSQPTG